MDIKSLIKKGPTTRPPKIMLIGVEGVGKSTAGANMPSPVFMCSESGMVGPQFADVPNFTPKSWKEALEFIDALAADPGDFKTLVVDTLDWLEPMLYAKVVADAKKPDIKNIEDFGYGKGYVLAQNEARQLIARLDKVNAAGMNVLLLSHSQLKTVKNPTGEDYDHFESKINAKVGGIFKEWADAVLFARFEVFTRKDGLKAKAYGGDTRVVETTHSAAWDAKNRFGLPEQMPLDMGSILEAITHGAGDEQKLVKEIENLVGELPVDKADKTIEWLKKPHTATELRKVLNNVKNAIKEADNG